MFAPEEWLEVLAQLAGRIGVKPVNHGIAVQKRLLNERPDLRAPNLTQSNLPHNI